MAENKTIKNRNARLDRAIDLKCKGLTDAEISAKMTEEGFPLVSERTIRRILSQVTDKRIIEELKRFQLRGITTAEIALQLKYRDKLLDKLIPKKIEQSGSFVLRVWRPDEDAGDYDKVLPS
jgi:hypothetical protein